ncbi:hypothetical protein ACHQM5_005435 [Ranunculus cassubicifolius]
MKRTHTDTTGSGSGSIPGSSNTAEGARFPSMDTGKMIWEDDAGDDELLAILGYKVRSSDMADVASKIEQLEIMMGSNIGNGNQEDGGGLLTHLGADTVHYNPSDMSTWLESMLSEAGDISIIPPIHTNQSLDHHPHFLAPAAESSTITSVDFPNCSSLPMIFDEPTCSDYDLSVIPGEAIYGERDKKRFKQENNSLSPISIQNQLIGGISMVESVPVAVTPSPSPSPAAAAGGRAITESNRPVVLIDSQENGIRLVHTLMACAEAVQTENLKLADSLVKQVSLLAASQAGAMRKVATYFAEALARRIYQFYPETLSLETSFADILQIHFYETCPHLKFAHFSANQAILDAVADAKRVHIIDFSMKQGIQWPALMQAFSQRPNGPPRFRLTGIGPPQPDNVDALQQVGWKLAQFAENLHIEFEYRGFVANSIADLDASMLDLRDNETVTVNSIFEMHQLLAKPGAIEKVLNCIKDTNPKIVTVAEQEADHNGPIFLNRFTEALHYYSTLFDSLEGYPLSPVDSPDLLMSEMYFGRQICNLVACEGEDRVERHETLTQWRNRFESDGFVMSPIGSNSYRQVNSLLNLFGGGGYKVEENNGCLYLGWHTRPLICASAWQLAEVTESNQ